MRPVLAIWRAEANSLPITTSQYSMVTLDPARRT